MQEEGLDLPSVIERDRQEPVLLVTADGKEFLIAEADDFDRKVETLRASPAFQRFLDERSRSIRRIPLEEVKAAIECELEARGEVT